MFYLQAMIVKLMCATGNLDAVLLLFRSYDIDSPSADLKKHVSSLKLFSLSIRVLALC